MISALTRAYEGVKDPQYREAAEEAARFLKTEMMRDRTLLRAHWRGSSHTPGFLEDYAFTVAALLDLNDVTSDTAWLKAAETLADEMVAEAVGSGI